MFCKKKKFLKEDERRLLKDVWRVQNPDDREYSWRKRGNLQKASRIDLALTSAGLDQQVKYVCYLSSIKTDHRAIYLVVDTALFERGIGYWKFNNNLLSDEVFIEQMNKEIAKTITLCHGKTAKNTWETLKRRIKKNVKTYTQNRSSEEKLIVSMLSEKVNEYEAKLPLTKEEDEMLHQTQLDLDEKMLDRAKGMLFRSKVKWYEEGELNTKYFYSLEKARYNAKTCYKIFDTSGRELTQPKEILMEQRKFYKELYDIEKDVEFTLVNNYGIKVPNSIKEDQNIQLTIEDIGKALQKMNNNKTPGEDGLSADFYKCFWAQLKDAFYSMIIECYEEEELSTSLKKGILNLIPKANKDARYIKNLRPITLLNTDYKIIEKAIANKILPALAHIIHRDQRGFMKDRRISVNIRKMLDIIHQADQQDLEAVVLSLDFVKCFDKCSFSILFGSLDFFGFGSLIQEWTKILYKDFTVKVQNNGYFSENILIKKGVHQGGCCSSLYFLIIADILVLALRSNDQIEGITIQDIRNLLNQFADDMDIFSLCKEESLKQIFSELDKFRKQSGFTVSYEKTTLYRIGSLRHSNSSMYDMTQFAWSNQDITVLGVSIAHEDITLKNYNTILDKVKTTLSSWNTRHLSLIGKVQVVNTLVASLFVHKMMVLPIIPVSIIKKVDNMIREFLWNGKKAKIAYKTLQNPKKSGGLNLVHLENKDKSLKATWPQILVSEPEYAKMVYGIMRCQVLGEDIWRCTIHPKDVKSMKFKSDFWKDVLTSWSEYNSCYQQRIENQIIWFNSRIKIGGKPILWNDVCLRGLKFVYQLYDGQKLKSSAAMYQEYGLTTLRYNGLISAIPEEWKNFFRQNELCTLFPLPPHNYDRVVYVYGTGVSKMVYNTIAEDAMVIHNKYLKWLQELGTNFCEGIYQFGLEHLNIYKVTNEAKYRSFQYRLLQRGLVTNIQLYKWKITTTELCSFCSEEKETIIHLMYHCKIVQELWGKIIKMLQEKFSNQVMDISPTAIIFNKVFKQVNHVGNFVCLIAKQYIYSQKCLGGQPNYPVLVQRLRSLQAIERYIAIKNGKLRKHEKKWANF